MASPSEERRQSAVNVPINSNTEDESMDDDDDDMEFHESTDQSATDDTEEEMDEEGYYDAEEGDLDLSGVEIEFVNDQDNPDDNMEAESEMEGSPPPVRQTAEPVRRTMAVTRNMLLQLLGREGLVQLLADHRTGHTAEDDGAESGGPRTRRKRPAYIPPTGPNEEGRKLMQSGTFGTNERNEGTFARKKRLAYMIMQRELALGCLGKQRSYNNLMKQHLIPSSSPDTIIKFANKVYSGSFSDDGNFFFACSQDFRVRMYDTSNPYAWKYYKTVHYPYGQWTITDASLSPDNKYLAYSSIKPVVCLANTDPGETSEPYLLDFSDTGRRRRGYGHFGIWSIRFSGDGREIVAGTSNRSVYVYDIETRRSILQIEGHSDEVNAVCFGDKSSPHILYSGSDDTTLKVWDRRSMGDGREAGVFLGHTEGLTYVDSKGDGRYVLSNGKDQTMKLWDLRNMISTDRADRIDPMKFSTGFDYRFTTYHVEDYRPHPHDCSLVTFRGHTVLKTLIRCHFSPPGSTDSRYVYSGSENGSVYIYNLDSTLAGKVDVNSATRSATSGGSRTITDSYARYAGTGSMCCVRDASWHPTAPLIAATAWSGWGESGVCSVHSWNDGVDEDEAEPGMRLCVDAELNQFGDCGRPTGATNVRRSARLRSRRQEVEEESDELGIS